MWPDDYNAPYSGSEHPEEELAAFALNALDDAEFQAVFHHVIRCPHCQEVLLGFQETAARLAEAAPEVPLPPGLKARVLPGAVGANPGGEAAPALPPPDARWSLRRLRRWIAPVAIGTLSLLLAASIGFMVSQQREIDSLTAASERAAQQQSVSPTIPIEKTASSLNPTQGANGTASEDVSHEMNAGNDGTVDHVKQEVADMAEAMVMSAQPETEKLPMNSPMGTEPEAKGVLMVDPSGMQGVLMVSGMPADSYQIWLVRDDKRMLVDRIVVNEDDGSGVQQLELAESVFGFHEVALLPDERHGPTSPTGEKFLSARIIAGPPAGR